jgi:putative PIN family toxin of toxin-antitoxin system
LKEVNIGNDASIRWVEHGLHGSLRVGRGVARLLTRKFSKRPVPCPGVDLLCVNCSNITRNIMRLKFLLDTNVLVAGLSSRLGASFGLLQAIASERLSFVASPTLWLEYEAVLKRDEIRQLHQLSVVDVDNFLDGLAGLVTPVSLHFDWRPQLRDAGDEMVLQAAVNGNVDALVTHNVADFAMAKDRFNLTVWTPGTALKRLEQLELKEKYK